MIFCEHFNREVTLKIAMVMVACFGFIHSEAQMLVERSDTTVILLSSYDVQLECTEALNDLYNFNFGAAKEQFRFLRTKYPWHPLPYFFMGLTEWWKIMPNTKDQSHDELFLTYMDSTIMVAKNLYKRYPAHRTEAAFFLSASYGFKGRLYSDEERKQWRKAASAGKEALDYLEKIKGKSDLSPELLFGDALYNYFSVWVPENYPALKPILLFFPKGDKELGLKQLKEVSYNAFYTRVEAMVWLMRILNSYENDKKQAFELSEYLYKNYPDNPYFHRYYARMLYTMGKFSQTIPVCEEILQRIANGVYGYEGTSGRYASFFLGQVYEARKDLAQAKKYYLMCTHFAEQIDALDTGYYLYSLIALGEIAEKEGDTALARKYYKMAKKRSDRKDESFKSAKKRLKKMEKGD